MFYAIVGVTKTVVDSWTKVERLKLLNPYSSVRKFRTEEEAWEYVTKSRRKVGIPNSINKFGMDLFKDKHVTIDYIIGEENVYYNINVEKIGYINLYSNDKDIKVLAGQDNIAVKYCNLSLNKDLLISHLIAIVNILDLVGDLVDIEIILPSISVFYLIHNYKGNNTRIRRMIKRIQNRQARVAYTVKKTVERSITHEEN